MVTMARAIRGFMEAAEGIVTSDEIKEHIRSEYADRWRDGTLQAHLHGCVVNNPKAYIHHPYVEKFLYRRGDGTFELYSESLHGPNEWAPDMSDEESGPTDLIEASISLERDIEEYLIHNLNAIESNLQFVGRQVSTDVGRVDILAEAPDGALVVVEVKVGEAKDSAIGQIARYLGYYMGTEERHVRGILIARNFPDSVRYATTAIPNLALVAYRVHFAFEEVR